jgi:hypothetical protein
MYTYAYVHTYDAVCVKETKCCYDERAVDRLSSSPQAKLTDIRTTTPAEQFTPRHNALQPPQVLKFLHLNFPAALYFRRRSFSCLNINVATLAVP